MQKSTFSVNFFIRRTRLGKSGETDKCGGFSNQKPQPRDGARFRAFSQNQEASGTKYDDSLYEVFEEGCKPLPRQWLDDS